MHVYPHRIRLRGPWQFEPLARFVQRDGRVDMATDHLPAGGRMTMPCRWEDAGLSGFAGRVRLRRRFGYPGNIDEFERVWLIFAGVEDSAAISLNGTDIGQFAESDCPHELEITKLLRPRNELVCDVECATENGGLYGEVAMEIRRTAFLRGLTASITKREDYRSVRVTGSLIGTCERPLDLYILAHGKTIGCDSVQSDKNGGEVSLCCNGEIIDGNEPLAVQVELVDGGVVWHSQTVPIEPKLDH